MIQLSYIKMDIQQLAEALSSVIKLDVTIVDKNFERLAGTGVYIGMVGTKVCPGSSFDYVKRTGKRISIFNAGKEEVCQNCSFKDNCFTKANITSPIIVQDEVEGFLSLTAFNDAQKERLFIAERDYIEFITKISDLITSKLIQLETCTELVRASSRMEAILNSVHEGIIATDDTGLIISCNPSSIKLLDIKRGNILNANIINIFPSGIVKDLLESGHGFSEQEIFSNERLGGLHYLANGEPIISDGKVKGLVLTFKDICDVHRYFVGASISSKFSFEDIIGESIILDNVKQKARRAAQTVSTVIIRGESGTGKELFARAIHWTSTRRQGPFITINCGAIPESLLESELFGYDEGAFTGAKRSGKPGKFELANSGTLFLDEIGDMSLHLQVKLLRILQDGIYTRVGGRKELRTNVRIIAATHRPLEDMVERSEFRQDLFFRLNVIPIVLPSLRERKEDILLLLHYFFKKYNKSLHKNVTTIPNEVKEKILNYDWPGNVRELQNTVEYCMNMITSNTITLEHLPQQIQISANNSFPQDKLNPINKVIEETYRKAFIMHGRTEIGIQKISSELGVSRGTVYKKLKEYNI